MALTDEDAALECITTLIPLSPERASSSTRIDALLNSRTSDPFPDIHELFSLYNILYFRSLLLPRVEVSWSSRLTLCAGICELVKDAQGKYRRIRLKLSEPLLRYRPREDMVNTLLHEAIHAYFFITTSWRHTRDDGHGAGFQLLADAISNHGGYEITVYHTFHDEVDSYRKHIWQCNGRCKDQPPHLGVVKRSMNRAPGPSDWWWKDHQVKCGGQYEKIAEPEMTKEQERRLAGMKRAGRQKNKIDKWVKRGEFTSPQEAIERPAEDTVQVGEGSTKGGAPSAEHFGEDYCSEKKKLVACPVCDQPVVGNSMNSHLDMEHPP